jgi:elongation factor P--(R)-beta-lysine ligase
LGQRETVSFLKVLLFFTLHVNYTLTHMSYSPFDFRAKRREWSYFLKQIRQFLDQRHFTEVTTPSLVSCGAFESTIDTLKVTYGTGAEELHSSPEIEMKNVLAEFPHAIYQICKCFRDDPESTIHAREFSMLEFYQPDTSSKELETLTVNLINFLCPSPIKFRHLTVYDLIRKLTSLELELLPTKDKLFEAVKHSTHIHLSSNDSWSDIFFKVMIEIVEPSLPEDELCLLSEYPSQVSPLSEPIPGTSRAERFEIYWKKMEICNGCKELSDEGKLRRRYQEESQERIKAAKTPHPEPLSLYQSASRLGSVSGVAIGLERLFLAIYGSTNETKK